MTAPNEETGWIVERSSPYNAPVYLMVCGHRPDIVNLCTGKLEWTTNANYALRFSRNEDAVLFVGMIRSLSDKLLHKDTLPGLRSGDDTPFVREHIWSKP